MERFFKEGFIEKMKELESHLNVNIVDGKKVFDSFINDKETQAAIDVAEEIVDMGFVDNAIIYFLGIRYGLYGISELQFVYDEFTEEQLYWELQNEIIKHLASGKYFIATDNENIARAAFIKYLSMAMKDFYANIICDCAKEKYDLNTRVLKLYVWWRTNLPGDIEIRDYTNSEIISMMDPKFLELPRFKRKNIASTLKAIESELNRVRRAFGMTVDSINLVSNDTIETAMSLEVFDEDFMPGIDKAVILDRFNSMTDENRIIITMFSDGYTYKAIGERFNMSHMGAKKRVLKIIEFLKTGEYTGKHL